MNLIRPLLLLVLLWLPRLGLAQKLIVGKGVWIPTEKGTYNISVDDSLFFRLTSRTLGTLPARIKASNVVGLAPQINRKANQSDVDALGIQPGSRNLYNYATNTPGIYQDNLGVYHTDADYSLSFRIKVTPGHTYYPSNKQYIVFLDSSEVAFESLVGFYNRATIQVVAPAKARYARLTIPNSLLTSFQFWDGSAPTSTEPYSLSANLITPQATTALSTATLAQANARLSLGQVRQSWNLFDPGDVAGRTMGKYVSQLGIEVTDATYFITPYIPIRAGIPHIESHKQLISYSGAPDPITGIPVSLSVGELSTRTGNGFTPPEGAEFMRLTVAVANLNTFMVGEGTSLPGSYIPYSRVLVGETQAATTALASATTTAALLPATANIVSPTTSVTLGYYSTDLGVRVAASGFAIMGPIKTKPNTLYHTDFGTNPPTDPQFVTYVKSDGTYEGGVPYSRGTHSFTTTANTDAVIITTAPSLTATTQVLEGASTPRISYGRMLAPSVLITTGTYGKKILVDGTSIPWGGGFYERACAQLGIKLFNVAQPSASLRGWGRGYVWAGEQWANITRSKVHTVAEKKFIVAKWDSLKTIFAGSPPASLSPADTAYIINCSYERSIIPHIDGTPGVEQVDAIYEESGYNDIRSYETQSEFITIPTSGTARTGRDTYPGAFNFMMDEIRKANPTIPVIVHGHYDFQRDERVALAQQALATYHGLHIIKTWEKTGWSQRLIPGSASKWLVAPWLGQTLKVGEAGYPSDMTMLRYAMPDGTHTYSDTTDRAKYVMVNILIPELRAQFSSVTPTPSN